MAFQPFSFTPDENDPELGLRRRRIGRDTERNKMDILNEISRAGLLGSSTSFNLLEESQSRGNEALEDAQADVFMKRRLEALDQYNREQDFQRQMKLMDYQADLNKPSFLESIGGLAGGFLGMSGFNPMSLLGGKPKLPMNSINSLQQSPFNPTEFLQPRGARF